VVCLYPNDLNDQEGFWDRYRCIYASTLRPLSETIRIWSFRINRPGTIIVGIVPLGKQWCDDARFAWLWLDTGRHWWATTDEYKTPNRLRDMDHPRDSGVIDVNGVKNGTMVRFVADLASGSVSLHLGDNFHPNIWSRITDLAQWTPYICVAMTACVTIQRSYTME
jgi:hypothetical protein